MTAKALFYYALAVIVGIVAFILLISGVGSIGAIPTSVGACLLIKYDNTQAEKSKK